MLLSLVVPVYREEKNIPEFLRRIGGILGALTSDYEIIFAMDPSPDRTEDVIPRAPGGGPSDQAPQVLKGGSGSLWLASRGWSTRAATP